jgi:hypothetical protein
VVEISIGMSVMNALFIGTLSLTIFLNRLDKISNNFVLSALSWLASPGCWIGDLLFHDQDVFVLINTLPYLCSLIFTFWRFRTRLIASTTNRPALEIITRETRNRSNGKNTDDWMGLTGGED